MAAKREEILHSQDQHSGAVKAPAAAVHEAPAEQAPAGPAFVTRRKPELLTRLRRVEGQVRGLQRMVEEDKYCPDILTQVAAVRAALDQVGLILLEDHTRGCVARALQEGDDSGSRHGGPDEMIEELLGIVKRFVR